MMIVLLSPTKTMNQDFLETSYGFIQMTQPIFMEQTERIHSFLRELDVQSLSQLMKIKESLAIDTYEKIQSFMVNEKGIPAIYAYEGLVYKQLEKTSYGVRELEYLNDKVRILSGLYGMLKPLDEIKPYRLEIKTPLILPEGNLYHIWKDIVPTAILNENKKVVNLASKEYTKHLQHLSKTNPWIDIEFYVMENGHLKNKGTLSKMARGQMLQYMVSEKIENVEELKKFQWNGFSCIPKLTTDERYIFVKDYIG